MLASPRSYGPETTRKGIALRGVSFLRGSVVDGALIGAGPGPGDFVESRKETVRKVPEAPETRAHKAPKPARSPRFGPDSRAKYTP